MIANVSKTNNSKRLMAAIAVFAMIACCLAVVLPSEDLSAEPIKPTAETDPFTGIDGITYDATNGVYTVSKAVTITLDPAKEYGTEQNPLNVRFVINDGASLTFTNSAEQIANVYIQYVITDWDAAHVLINSGEGSGDKAKVAFDGNVNVNLSIDKASTVTQTGNCHLLCDINTDVTDGATLTLSQTTNVGGKAYYEGTEGSTLTITNAKVVLDRSGGIGPTVAMNGATLEVTNPRAGNAFINLGDGSTITDSKIVIPQQDFSDNQGTSVYIPTKGTSGVSITDSDLDLGNSYLVMVPGAELTATGSTINANAVALRDSTEDKAVTIIGGTINADLTLTYPGYTGLTSNDYTLNGATLGNSNIVKDVAVKAGTNGIGISGNVTAVTGSAIDLTSGGLNVYSGANANLAQAKFSGSSGITVGTNADCSVPTGYTPKEIGEKDTANVETYDKLVEAVMLGYPTINLSKGITLDGNLSVPAGVAIVGGSNAITLGENTIAVNGGSVNSEITGGNSESATINLTGNFTIKAGSVVIEDLNGTNPVTSTNPDGDSITVRSGDKVQITGALNSKLTVNLDGGEVLLKDLNITSSGSIYFTGTKVEVSNVPAVTTTGTVTVYGQIMSVNKMEIQVASEMTFRAYGGSVLQDTVAVVGADDKAIINLDGAMHTLTINDDINSSNTYGQTQTVVIGSTLDIVSGTTVIIQGQFVVNEGVTLTIQDGAKLIINGTTCVMDVNGNIIVDAGGKLTVTDSQAVDIAGSVQIYGTMDIEAGKVTIQENGNVAVAVDGLLDIALGESTEIKAGATLDILGGFTIGAVTNEGTISLTGAVMNGVSNITLKNGGAVNVNSYSASGNFNLTVKDEGANQIQFAGNTTAGAGFAGTVVTAEKTGTTEKPVYTLYVSGSIAGVDNSDGQTIKAFGAAVSGTGIAVTGDLTLGEGVTLTVNSGAKVAVSGTLTATAKDSKIDNKGTIDVTGTITATTEINTGVVNAAYYVTTVTTGTNAGTTYTYTTFENAVQSGATRVTVGVGTGSVVTVLADVTVPGTVTMVTVTGTMNIGDADNRDITVTVNDGARVTGKIIVYATLTFDNSRNDNAAVTSDVIINAEPARTYTNLYTALASGAETVTLAGPVILTSSIEVPAGTTLVVPAGTGVQFNAGVTMTVNGAVQTAMDFTTGTYKDSTGTEKQVAFTDKTASTTDGTAKIVVNGKLMSSVTGKTADVLYGEYKIPGAYYNISDATGAFIVVAPVATAAAENAADIVEGIIAVYGEVSMGDIAFNGTESDMLSVIVYGKTTGNVTLSYTAFSVVDAKRSSTAQFTGTISSEIGSVKLVNVNYVIVADTFVEKDGKDVEYMYLYGTPAQADAKVDSSISVVSGNVTVPAVTGEVALDIATVPAAGDVPAHNAVALDVTSGATLTVNGQLNAYDITVDGTLVSIDGGIVKLTEAFIFGTLTVAENDTEAKINAGSAEIGTLYVGLDKKYDNMTAATVNGTVAVTDKMVVSAEATVSEDMLEDFSASTAFSVEGSVWFTAYGDSASTDVVIKDVAVENADFLGWAEEEDGDLIYVDPNATNKVAQTAFGIGDYETLYAVIDYEIYSVSITADAGIGTVAIDGKVLQQIGGNVFEISGLKAGTHTIDYILNSGYEGTPVISVNGTVITGNTFTLSGTSDADVNVQISIYGTQPSTSGGEIVVNTGSDDMSLTDILLIVLVVLIVIMAVIVALRLMRS